MNVARSSNNRKLIWKYIIREGTHSNHSNALDVFYMVYMMEFVTPLLPFCSVSQEVFNYVQKIWSTGCIYSTWKHRFDICSMLIIEMMPSNCPVELFYAFRFCLCSPMSEKILFCSITRPPQCIIGLIFVPAADLRLFYLWMTINYIILNVPSRQSFFAILFCR